MSGHHQPPGSSPRGPASYPAAPSLSSSSAAVSYHHPPQNHYAPYNHQHSAPPPSSDAAYRAGPAPSNSMTLPSMRTIDSMTQSASHSAGPSQSLSTPMPAGSGHMSSFYPVRQSSTLGSNYAISPEVVARYAAMPYSANSVLHRTPKKVRAHSYASRAYGGRRRRESLRKCSRGGRLRPSLVRTGRAGERKRRGNMFETKQCPG
jgi:hypothetical protein